MAELAEVVRAGQHRLSGHPEIAIKQLLAQAKGNALFQTHTALMDAYAAAGDYKAALSEARWLEQHRGLAYIEQAGGQVLQAMNVFDSRLAHLHAAEFHACLEQPKEAQREAQAFQAAWPPDELPDYLRRKTFSILPASKQ